MTASTVIRTAGIVCGTCTFQTKRCQNADSKAEGGVQTAIRRTMASKAGIRARFSPTHTTTCGFGIDLPSNRCCQRVTRFQVQVSSSVPAEVEEPAKATSMVLPVLGAMILNASMGSMYTWSIFLASFEAVLGVPRATLSLVFSSAMAAFSVIMFGGVRLHAWMPTPLAATLAMVQAGMGLILAGSSTNYMGLVAGFGLVYGSSVGIGYGIALGSANLVKSSKGLITGIVVAAFATTPVFLAPLIKLGVSSMGPHATLRLLGVAIAALTPAVFACFHFGKVQIPMPPAADKRTRPVPFSVLAKVWLGFFSGAIGGLMVFAHAAGVITTFGGTAAQVVQGVQYCAFGNWTGRLLAGLGSDHIGPKLVLALAAVGSSLALVILQLCFQGNALAATGALIVVGAGFGCALTAYPVLTRKMVGSENFGALFGKVFTGFGVCAFIGPVLAGYLFDKFGTYSATLVIASIACIVSTGFLAALPKYVE